MIRTFEIPIYGSQVLLVRNQGDLERACDKLGVELPPKNTDGICVEADYHDGTTKFILAWLSKDVSVLAHEAVHLSQFILVRAGIDPRDSHGETMAYLVGWIVDKGVKSK